MDKLVNICPSRPILALNPPIRCATNRIFKSEEEIKECLLANARVEEILPNGGIVELTFDNYNTDNTIKKEDIIKTTEQTISIDKSESKIASIDSKFDRKYNKKNKNKNKYIQSSEKIEENNEMDKSLSSDDKEIIDTVDVENI